MRAIALGTSAAYPGAGDACTGWLVQEDGTNLLLDCGTGVLGKLQEQLPLPALDAAVISHMHADHFLDLFPMRYAFKYGIRPQVLGPEVYVPPGGLAVLERMAGFLNEERTEGFFAGSLRMREYDPQEVLRVGSMALRFAPGSHYVPSWAISVESHGRRLVFTADTAPSPHVLHLAAGADLLITEATYLTLDEENPDARGHMTAREAGELAAQAGARRTLLTHVWPGRDLELVLGEARNACPGDVSMAQSGKVYEV